MGRVVIEMREVVIGTGKAYLLVRAHVANPSDRPKFDQWYHMHHLPYAKEKLKAESGWRFWSRSDPSIHYALYQFDSMEVLHERMDSPQLKSLLVDFDLAFPQVTRTRELIEMMQEV
jgi:hypothetical protein